ncbi:MAG: hypothetical protein DRI95_15615 [Bacteroidetes bacterium]|nr:MAG: hypothetical protein DRI95_15615 [Bacteroidota bacterium]RLD79963.1 MAG: hypothetical protein DRJ07_11065 [Bacteroidota bacterium]
MKKGSYVVFFDLDRTLLSINSGPVLVWTAYKKGLMSTQELLKAIILSLMYKLRLKNTVKAAESMAKWLKGIPETSIIELSKQLVEENLILKLRSSMIHEIEQHKNKGANVVILSAALPYICDPIADYLGIKDVICSGMETTDGMFTGKPLEHICLGPEKEIRASQYCFDKSYYLQEAYSYGDSYSDRFILKSTGNPICVSPDKRLRKLAKIMNWPIME